MTAPHEWVKKPLVVGPVHDEKNRYQASRFLARPACFPNGDPGVAIYHNGKIIAVFPEHDAQTLIFHMGKALRRVGGSPQRPSRGPAENQGDE